MFSSCQMAQVRLRTIHLIALVALIAMLAPNRVAEADPGAVDLDQLVTLNLESMKLGDALNMMANQFGLNMVASDAGGVVVSLFLNDVTLEDALESLLFPNGFNYYIRGNIIVVTSDENPGVGSMSTLYYRLKFIPALMAQNAVTPLLSKTGKAEVIVPEGGSSNEETPSVSPNAIMIHDFPGVLREAERLLKEVDQPERMVMIEVKMVESKIDVKDIIGVNWPTSVSARVSDQGASALNSIGSGTGSGTTTGGTGTATGNLSTGSLLQKSAVSKNLSQGGWNWGTLSIDELVTTLDFLQSSGKSKLISHPKLATLENHMAEFKVATIVPVQTINRFSQGTSTSDIVTFQDIEVGITLQVTPRINEDGVITMDVFPRVEEIIGFVGTKDQQKPITTERSVRTMVTCKEGQTIVIGGLLRENEIINERKVFILGDIPILGALFKHKTTTKENTDLLILITPRIM